MNKEEMESAVDKKTKEFVFIERESFDRGDSRGRTARVSMEQINVKE